MKKKIFAIVAFGVFLQSSFSAGAAPAGNMDKGDYLFRHNAFKEAAKEYEQLKSAAPRRKDAVLDSKIADCYRLTKRPEEALVWYGKAVGATRGVTKEMKLHYGEVLMTLQCYEDAAYWIGQYAKLTPKSRKAANMLKGCNMAQAMQSGEPEGTITFLPLNTDGADFAPAMVNQGLAFTSNATDIGAARKDKWTGAAYDNIYKVTCSGNGDCNSDYELIGGKASSKYHDAVATFSKDGKQMYFTRTMAESDMFGQAVVADSKGTVHLEIMIADEYDVTWNEKDDAKSEKVIEALENERKKKEKEKSEKDEDD